MILLTKNRYQYQTIIWSFNMESPEIEQLSYRLVFLADAYPKKNVQELFACFAKPAIELDLAMRLAIENKWMEQNGDKNHVNVLETPGYHFSDDIYKVQRNVLSFMKYLSADEQDYPEQYMMNMLTGYEPDAILVAMKLLFDTKQLIEYTLTVNGEGNYVFYTLPDNNGKLWGKKLFKKLKKVSLLKEA